MQPQQYNDTPEEIQRLNIKKMREHLARPEIKQVNVFRLEEGKEVTIYDKRYRIVNVRSRGRIELKEIGPALPDPDLKPPTFELLSEG